ncbi:MAG: tetratricopeptide repeat protein [Aggregatilineales bacterium]
MGLTLLLILMIGAPLHAQDDDGDDTRYDSNPTDCDVSLDYVELATEAVDAGDMEQVIHDLSCNIKTDPSSYDAWYLRGFYFAVNDQHEAAIADYTRAIEIDATEPVGYSDRAFSLYMLGEYQNAINDYTRAIELDPDDPNAHYSRAGVYSEIEDHQAAIDDYTRVIELDPDNSSTYNNRGWQYELIGEMTLSAADYYQHIIMTREYLEDTYLRYGFTQTLYMEPDNYYRVWFDAREGDIIDITVNSEDGGIDPMIVLVSDDDTPLYANDDRDLDNGDYNSAIFGYVIPETGTYQLYVNQWLEDANFGMLEVLIEAGVSY